MNPSYPVYDFFQWIAHIFEDFLFIPIDYMRHWQDQTWWGANLINWVFIIIFLLAFGYWLNQLKLFYEYDKENKPETHR